MNTREAMEIEATLMVYSPEPQVILSQISALTSVAVYELLPAGIRLIRDSYLDTGDDALQAGRLALRVREIDSTYLLTLKGPGHTTDSLGVAREEIEEEWSLDAFSQVMSELADRGISIRKPNQKSERADPLEVAGSAGFKVVQERETRREIRNLVLSGDKAEEILAELAIDSVVYRFMDREFRLHEVEVELKGKGDGAVLRDVVQGLRSMWEHELRDWPHSKLATGKAIEQLLESGELQGMIDKHDHLHREAYNQIDDFLR